MFIVHCALNLGIMSCDLRVELYLIFCGLVSKLFFFRTVQQVHTQPVVTIINSSINRPIIAPVIGSTMFVWLVAVSSLNENGDEYLLVCTMVDE